MSENLNVEKSDVTEVTIEADDTPGPLAQLNEFKETGPPLWESAAIALPCFGASLFCTLAVMQMVEHIPFVLFVSMLLVPVVASLATVAQLRRWFLKKLNSPVGCSASRAIRFLGSMLMLLCVLLGLALSSNSVVTLEQQLLKLGCCFALGVLMRLFPRGELN